MGATSPEGSGRGPAAFPDERLPEGAVVDGASRDGAKRDVEEAFDFVVIGTGASGAVAAHTLARAGFSVAMIEEGAWVKTRDFGASVRNAFGTLLRDAGMQVLEGHSYLPMLQGRCVGGSTVVNSAIVWRTPEDVLDDWGTRFGLASVVNPALLAPHFDVLESDLHVRTVDDRVLGRNNASFVEQATARSISPHVMERYDAGCRGSGRCLQGCPHAAKQGMNVSYVPWALALGARVFTSSRVEKIETRGARARAVLARTASGKRLRIVAERGVLVAASTIQTPNILRRSGVRAHALGRHFQVHPGTGMTARFDDPIDMQFGATQGAESIHFRKTHRFKLETISMPPELAAARIPGVGADLVERLSAYRHVAVWAAQIRAEAEGTVHPRWGGGDRATLSLTENDMRTARVACATLAEMFFDAGAREVWPGIHGVPSVLRSRDDVRLVAEGPLDSRAYSFIATHLFGAARMGPDPKTSVVGLDFSVHGLPNVYVVDSSVFPTNLGVNPQHSIMAIARLAACRIADHASGRRAA